MHLFNSGDFQKIRNYIKKTPALAACNTAYLEKIYPLVTDISVVAHKNIPIISLIDFVMQNLPVPVSSAAVTGSVIASLEFNRSNFINNRGITYLRSEISKRIPASATTFIGCDAQFIRHIEELISRPTEAIRDEEKRILETGFHTTSRAFQISEAIRKIVDSGKSCDRFSKTAMKKTYGLSERDYSRLRQLIGAMANGNGSLVLTNKGLQRSVKPVFTLTEKNLHRLQDHAARMRKTPDQTLNRLVHDFFTMLEQEMRLEKLNRR